jgi:hypothetical protein
VEESSPKVAGVSAARVPWSSASFLVYLGGLTILAAQPDGAVDDGNAVALFRTPLAT